MAGEVSAASWSSGEAAAKKLQDARRDALKTALTLQARVLRLSVLSTAVRQKVRLRNARSAAQCRRASPESRGGTQLEGGSARPSCACVAGLT